LYLVAQGPDGRKEGLPRIERSAPGVGGPVEPPAIADERPGVKRAQAQRTVVENPLSFRVPGEQDLKAPVQQKTLGPVGANPAPHTVGGLQDKNGPPPLLQPERATQAGEPRPDHDDVRFTFHFFGSWE
jgi:hypothetical protein